MRGAPAQAANALFTRAQVDARMAAAPEGERRDVLRDIVSQMVRAVLEIRASSTRRNRCASSASIR